MNFKTLENYKYARSALSMLVKINPGFIMNMQLDPRMISSLYSLLANCPRIDLEDPLRTEHALLDRFQHVGGTFQLLVKFISAFMSLDNKLTVDRNKDEAINHTAMYLQATIAEAQGTRKSGKINLHPSFKDLIFEEIDEFVYQIEQA